MGGRERPVAFYSPGAQPARTCNPLSADGIGPNNPSADQVACWRLRRAGMSSEVLLLGLSGSSTAQSPSGW